MGNPGWRGIVLPLACVAVVWVSGHVVVGGRAQGAAQWLGDITYGTYLLHPMVFFGFAWFVLPAFTPGSIETLPVPVRQGEPLLAEPSLSWRLTPRGLALVADRHQANLGGPAFAVGAAMLPVEDFDSLVEAGEYVAAAGDVLAKQMTAEGAAASIDAAIAQVEAKLH